MFFINDVLSEEHTGLVSHLAVIMGVALHINCSVVLQDKHTDVSKPKSTTN